MIKYKNIISRFRGKRILVIGDLVLDQYIKGSVSRISPEAPVPIVLQREAFYTPGGAANVANNLSSLGADVTLVGKIGDDIEGGILKRELKKLKVHTRGILVDPRVDTIFKTRIIAQHQQVVRVDRERVLEGGYDDFKRTRVWPFIDKGFDKFQAVIISDYGKGMIDSQMVNKICVLTRARKIPVIVDPKVDDFRYYGHPTCITPNKKEAEEALRAIPEQVRVSFGITSVRMDGVDTIQKAGMGLLKYLGIESLLITLGEHGMYLFEHGKEPFPIPTRAQEVYDVSGAGDTVISVFALSCAAGASKRQAADIANYAAGVVVGKMGAVAVTKSELLEAIRRHHGAV